MWAQYCAVLLVIGVQSAPRNYHSSLVPENECLQEKNLKMDSLYSEVHRDGILNIENAQKIGDYLMCVWRKRQIVDANLKIDSQYIARYFYDIYFKLNLSEIEKTKIQDALEVCEEEHADEEYMLGLNIKDCMFRVSKGLEFLRRKVSE
ncbi:hypothetical protein FQR65_LT03173 [Abscondita terminalis]|nr:hypothetical protein FQR65_LT03173 [Abscondita terminalis]